MKGDIPRITLLGNNSGRNLGDAAILAAILDSISRLLPKAEFLVPSMNPQFVNDNYGKEYRVKGIDVRPATFSLRLLGLPTIRALIKSDLALICDGIIFGHKFFSPHNFLITLIFIVPLARLFRGKVVCYSCGIGPFPSRLSELFARFVINRCEMVIMRDNDSKELAEKIGVKRPIEVRGDIAFLNSVSDDGVAEKILNKLGIDSERPLLGINITSYLDAWLKRSERLEAREQFFERIAGGIRRAKEEIAAHGEREPQCVIFSCSPMDEEVIKQLAERISASVIDNSSYLSHDIQSVMRRCTLLVGMRVHSLILSSAVGVPIVGLVYAPKVKGYLELLGTPEYAVPLKDLTEESLASVIVRAWGEREEITLRQQKVVHELREKAGEAAKLLVERLC